MLPPKTLQLAGGLLGLAGLAVAFRIGDLDLAIVTLLLAAGVVAASVAGGGPRPVPGTGYDREQALELLARTTRAAAVVATSVLGAALFLVMVKRADAFDLLVAFTLAVLIVFGSMAAAAALVLVAGGRRAA